MWDRTPSPSTDIDDATLGSLFRTFLKLGATASGGLMALISMVQNYVVERRRLPATRASAVRQHGKYGWFKRSIRS